MIPDSVVDEVRARADIVEIVGEQVPLKRAGKEFRALCPFHTEKTPSFYVVPAKGFYKCFGCGESGDVFTFLMKRQGLEFQDAVRALAARVGVEIPDERAGRREEEAHKAVREAVAFAADFYRRTLWESAAGERARRYLAGRGIEREAAERFQLGAAPDEWRAIRDAARKHGIADEVLLDAGLIKPSDRPDGPYDRLRDRLIFPICDVGGRVVAFGGRVLGKAAEGVPKYLNSPDTPIYQKGHLLYGLNWARGAIRREAAALVVEGYMDYVSLAARGIENVVAGLGTAMTGEQAALLARYSRTAYLLYDSDPAGLRATFRTGDALLRAGVHPLVVTLPAGEDPDSVVRAGGAQALRPLLEAAVDVLERKVQILGEHGYLEDVDGLRRALDRLLPTLRAAADPALRDIYVARVAERTGVRRETLEAELAPGGGGRTLKPARREAPPAPAGRGSAREEQWAAERMMLTLLLADPTRLAAAAAAVKPEEFRDPLHRQLFELLLRDGVPTGDEEVAHLSPEARARLLELLRERPAVTDGDQMFADVVASLRIPGILRRIGAVDRLLKTSPESRHEELARERLRLQRELEELGAASAKIGNKASSWGRKYRDRDVGPSTQMS
ncbi:MAG TPA: DNA primase [Longimicrobiales bacterium]|nr:DNA primase [Longimicrobiales bacterium]